MSIDNCFGGMPDACVNEPLPHLLKAEKDCSDEPSPFVWVYPFREYTTTEDEAKLRKILAALAMDEYDMIILDELVTAVEIGAVDRALAEQLFCNAPYEAELVLTGHSAPQWVAQKADYITEMKCVKHPYQSGLPAREGIEY